MALSEDEARKTAAHLLRLHETACQDRLDRLRDYMRGDHRRPYAPRSATHEYHELVRQSRVNVLPLVVSTIAQNLFVEGYRPARAPEDAEVWGIWQANRMDARQEGLYRAALTYGTSYATVLPGDPAPVVTPLSPRRLTAVYEDPISDEWPVYALAVSSTLVDGKPAKRLRLFDASHVYEFVGGDGQPLVLRRSDEHDLGVCPVVRWVTDYGDLDDGPQGEIEQLIPLQDQLNNTTFGLLMAQQYAAFRQRWVTGMAIPEDENGVPIEPFNAAVHRVWHAESPDTRFGEFEQTNLDGYLQSRESTLRLISSIAQIPPHAIASSGAIANLSAEALAAIEAGLQRKVSGYRASFGESVEQLMRLAGLAAGSQRAWEDDNAQVVWRDTESRSLAQLVDALGKMVQMLAIPPRALWERIPGVTDQDLQRWERLARESDAMARLEQIMSRGDQDAERAGAPADAPASG